MMRGRRQGVLIAGGGLAGCLAALALARHRPDVPLLVVEEQQRFGGDGFRFLFAAEAEAQARALLAPLVGLNWPGYYVALPQFSRKLKAPVGGIAPGALHEAMCATLNPSQYRLGARVVAVREDALVLDGGEEIRAEGAIDARGAANLSMLELLHETRVEVEYDLAAPHGLDRPVLIDATGEGPAGLHYRQVFPLAPRKLLIADVVIGERIEPDSQAGDRLEHYLAQRGWGKAKAGAARTGTRPLPIGGDFEAFWRIGGARAARLGLRGGFLHPATGRTIGDAARMAMLLTEQQDFSGAALHDRLEEQAKQLWRQREPLRAVNAALAGVEPAGREALLAQIYGLDSALVTRFQADRLGMVDRMKLHRALRTG